MSKYRHCSCSLQYQLLSLCCIVGILALTFLGSRGMNLCMYVYTSAHLYVCVFTLAVLLAY